MKKVVFITGSTSSGKSSFAHKLIDEYFNNSVIVSVDSMQVYKYLDIGSAKPCKDEIEKYNYKMIDIVSPLDKFSVKSYSEEFAKYINSSSNEIIFAVGGTGLYVESLKHGIFNEIDDNGKTREALSKELEEHGLNYLFDKLKKIDIEAAETIDRHNSRRVIRALEVYYKTGEKFSNMKNMRKKDADINYIEFTLNPCREKLYNNIDERVIKMFDDGLLEEVEKLIAMGVNLSNTSMQAIGYKECYQYLVDKTINKSELISLIQQKTRHYAKRQVTWFKKNSSNFIDLETLNLSNLVDEINNFLKN